MLRSAPPAEMPVPASDSASAPTVMPFWISRAAPLETVVPAAVVPSAVLFWMLRAPEVTVVAPM